MNAKTREWWFSSEPAAQQPATGSYVTLSLEVRVHYEFDSGCPMLRDRMGVPIAPAEPPSITILHVDFPSEEELESLILNELLQPQR